jgi:hypothetical protein
MKATKAGSREKLFPWRCWKCGEKAVHREAFPYTTEVKHDGSLYELALPALEAPRCQNCGEVVIDDAADEQISQALRDIVGLISPDDIRRCIKRLGLTQRQFATEVRIAPETVSRWLTRAQIQSKVYDDTMRRFFKDRGIPDPRSIDSDCPEGLASVANSAISSVNLSVTFNVIAEWQLSFQHVDNLNDVHAIAQFVAAQRMLLTIGNP